MTSVRTFHRRPDLRQTCDFNRWRSKRPGASRRIAERRKWMKLYPHDSARQLTGDRFPHALRQGAKLKPACPETFPLHSLHVSFPHPERQRFSRPASSAANPRSCFITRSNTRFFPLFVFLHSCFISIRFRELYCRDREFVQFYPSIEKKL